MTRRAKKYIAAAVTAAVTGLAAQSSHAALTVLYTFEDGTDASIQNFGTGPATGALQGTAFQFIEGTPAGRALRLTGSNTLIDTGALASALLGSVGRGPTPAAHDYTMSSVVTLENLVGDNMVFGYFPSTGPDRDALHNGFRDAGVHQGHWGADTTQGTVIANNRFHVAIRYSDVNGDGGDLEATLFVNGVPQGAPSTVGGLNNDQNIIIGTSRTDNGGFAGTLDNVRIYDNALSNAEIATLAAGDLTFVPEPSAAALLLLGAGGLAARRGRQRSS